MLAIVVIAESDLIFIIRTYIWHISNLVANSATDLKESEINGKHYFRYLL